MNNMQCLQRNDTIRQRAGGIKTMTLRPQEIEYAPYYSRYVTLVPETDVLSVLRSQVADLEKLATGVTAEQEVFRYSPGKWSIREVLGHLIDGDRVFGYRAFCLSRGEQAPLPSFDEKAYIAASHYNDGTVVDLLAEFLLVRNTNLTYLEGLTGSDWERKGTVSGNPITVLALVFIMAGHVRHHIDILRSRYGLVLGR
jgi:hypothetical protein